MAQQASALRNALQARSKKLDQLIPTADDLIYQQYLFRLRKERIDSSAKPWDAIVQWGQSKGQLAARVMVSNSAAAWAAAGVMVLIGFLLVQSFALQKSQVDADAVRTQMILRGGQGTVQIVEDPEHHAATLMAGLKAAGGDPFLVHDTTGRIRVTVKSRPEVLDYLATQRLDMATPDKDGFIAIVVEGANTTLRSMD